MYSLLDIDGSLPIKITDIIALNSDKYHDYYLLLLKVSGVVDL